jgi:chorismate mutase
MPNNQTHKRSTGATWADLENICGRIHNLWYVAKKKASTKRYYLNRLQRVLDELPANNMAILRQEGLALLHELKGETTEAIRCRKREIRLMEKLHQEVKSGNYDEKMKESILVDRDERVLRSRLAILKHLENRQHAVATKDR